jgi:hypothetical protein
MDGPLKPHQEGLRAGPSVDERGLVRKYELKPGRAKALGELTEFRFFTPAALYLHGRFTDAPLADFLAARPEARLFFKRFQRPVFRGLEARSNGDPGWNFGLWAVAAEHWRAFNDFLVSLTFTYQDERAVAGVGEQEFDVLDPLAADLCTLYHNGLPTVRVTTYGVNGSRFRAAFRAGHNPLTEPPTLRFYGPDPEMAAYADALYDGLNPVDARSAYRRRQTEEGAP